MKTFSCLLLLSCITLAYSATVRVQGSSLLVDEKPFVVKAVGYSPTPIGVDPTIDPPYGDYFTVDYTGMWKRDVALIKALGANTIKLWGWNNAGDHKAFLDVCSSVGLFVIPTFFMSPVLYVNLADVNTRAQVLADFGTFYANVSSHPAILFYNLGSDLNADWNYGPEKDVLFDVLNALVAQAKATQGANPRPFSTALNDQQSISVIQNYDASTQLDLWSLNVYRGCDVGNLFTDFPQVSTRPIFLSEYGIDAYNDLTQALDEQMQADCHAALWSAVSSYASVCVGGAVTEYVDEFWKSKLSQADGTHPTCPNTDSTIHTNCGYPNTLFPDGYANQAWFGLVDAQTFKPRLAYNQIQKIWNTTSY